MDFVSSKMIQLIDDLHLVEHSLSSGLLTDFGSSPVSGSFLDHFFIVGRIFILFPELL